MAGKDRACMQFSWTCTEKSLSDGTDSRFHETALWALLSWEEWNKKAAKKHIFWIISQLWTATNKNRRYTSTTELIVAKKVMPAKRKSKNYTHFFPKRNKCHQLMWITKKNWEKLWKEWTSLKWQAIKSIYLSVLRYKAFSWHKFIYNDIISLCPGK